jgi:hypothetical protein
MVMTSEYRDEAGCVAALALPESKPIQELSDIF